MYVVTKSGQKLPVDDSSVDYENDYVPFQQTVGLYTDDTTLKDVWILTLQRDIHKLDSFHPMELEFVADVKFTHEPTKEEILYAMSANGLSRYDVATVQKGLILDMEDD